jgi:hypothetical protein
MAAYEKRPGKGALFIKPSKSGENAPQLSGYFLLESGEEVRLNAWLVLSAKGEMYFSLSVRKNPSLAEALDKIQGVPVESKAEAQAEAATQNDDDVPF